MASLADRLTPIGYGAFKIGRNEGIKYPQGYELPEIPAVERLLNGILDLGVRYIDTAPAYGLSEERIGRAIAHRRDEYVLSTKVGETFENGASTYDFSRKAVGISIERSLKRLRCEVLDLVFVHAGRDDLAVIEQTDVVPALTAMRDKGLVRAVGFSGYSADAFAATWSWADAIMVMYHAEDRSLEPIMKEAARRGMAVIVKKGLASGHLPADEAIRFVLGNACVSSVVVGTLSLDHMRANVELARKLRMTTP